MPVECRQYDVYMAIIIRNIHSRTYNLYKILTYNALQHILV